MTRRSGLEQTLQFYEETLAFQQTIKEEDPRYPLIFALLGHPTAPLDPNIKKGMDLYWEEHGATAIPYGHPKGEPAERQKMAAALNSQYRCPNGFTAEDVIFTVGGLEGLHNIFYALRQLKRSNVVTPVPYYPVYSGFRDVDLPSLKLHLVDCMRPPYYLNHSFLEETLTTLSPEEIGAFLFCDPSNPLGTTPGLEEWKKIAKILQRYPATPIILDEAYYELSFHGEHCSLLHAAPQLINRIVLLRSATKGMSAAGERMAVTVCKDPAFMGHMLQNNMVGYLHPPKSHQYAYSYAMERLDAEALKKLSDFYADKVATVKQTLAETGLDQNLNIETTATFYVIANFSSMLSQKLHPEVQKITGRKTAKTDLDIAQELLWSHGLAFCPLSFFGIDEKLGYLRITCSATEKEMKILSKRLRVIGATYSGCAKL